MGADLELKETSPLHLRPNSKAVAEVDGTLREKTANGGMKHPPPPLVAGAGAGVMGVLTVNGLGGLLRNHPIPFFFALCVLFFMGVEYTLKMVPSSSPPFDIGFVLTRTLNEHLAVRPDLNSVLAALNTVYVVMQTVYIFWALLVEGRARATIAALFMFTCRGILGYCTQLPLPKEFLGSGMDFPVGNVSFFLFFSGHVAGGLIASLDMKRQERWALAWTYDSLNILQALRLLVTRGHYTIDLAVGVGAGLLFDSLAGKYEGERNRRQKDHLGRHKQLTSQNGGNGHACCSCHH